MLREGVRLDRVRGGRQKYKRKLDSTSAITFQNNGNKQLPASKVISHLLMAEPEKIYALPDMTSPTTNIKVLTTLCDLADRELVSIIGWAKHIPGFVYLTLADQMALLQSAWMEILMLSVVYRSINREGDVVFADDFVMDIDISNEIGMIELYSLLNQLKRRLKSLNVTKEEFVILKAIALVNSDSPHAGNDEALQRLQDTLQQALSGSERSFQRCGQLLLTMPLLRHIAGKAVQFFNDVRQSGNVNMHKLFAEMLDAKL